LLAAGGRYAALVRGLAVDDVATAAGSR